MKGEIGKHEPGRGTKAAAKTFGFLFPGCREKNEKGSEKKSASAAAKKKKAAQIKMQALPEKRKGEKKI